MAKYQGDPHWLTLRFAGKCSACGHTLPRQSEAFYYPNGNNMYGKECCSAANTSAAWFDAVAFDEDFGNHY